MIHPFLVPPVVNMLWVPLSREVCKKKKQKKTDDLSGAVNIQDILRCQTRGSLIGGEESREMNQYI